MTNKVNSFQVQGNKYGIEPDYVFDNTPTQGSTNPVTSNGIYEAINGVSLGSSVSYGRADGSPVGYCSIAYGTNNIASGDYSISIGKNNRVYNIKTVACGEDNITIGGGYSCVTIGKGNVTNAVQTTTLLGYSNQIGTMISTSPTRTSGGDNIFSGYFNPQNKKLYYDPAMQDEKPITLKNPNNGSTYILDLTNSPSNGRNPGDMYEYDKTYRGTTVAYVQNSYVKMIDASANTLYRYNGICYYDNANDKNYSDEAKTQEINITSKTYQDVWFDMISGDFIERGPWSQWGSREYGFYKPGGGDYPKWIKVNVYRGMVGGPSAIRSGIHAYINTDSGDGSHFGVPYSTADHIEGTELYNELIDGELVVDIATGKYWLYRFDVNNNIVFGLDYNTANIYDDITRGPMKGHSALALGHDNFTTGQTGSIVAGSGNTITGYSESSCVLGHYNELHIGYGQGDQCATFISGIHNYINGGGVYTHTYVAMGQGNNINAGQQSDRQFVIGCYNNFRQEIGGGYDVHVYGEYNELTSIASYTKIIGYNNRISHVGQTNIIGNFNQIGQELIGFSVRSATLRPDGIIEGTGISYNSTSKTYSIETDVLYNLYTKEVSPKGTNDVYIRSVVSTDGSTFTNAGPFVIHNAGLNVLGWNNYFKIRKGISGNGNTILGAYNTIVGCHGLSNITLAGYGLLCDYNTDMSNDYYGVVFTGGLNSMSGITGASFIVGNGTGSYASGNGRSNGLVVYRTGAVAAPSAPDTIAGGITAMANTGTSSDKMLITYAQMRDYTGPGGGGSSRPVATIITLLSTDWSSFEQTIQVSGVKTDSIVIIQPSGSAYAFNHDDIFLKAQANGELTFGCSAGPTVDIDVKVVYWA